MVMTQMAALTTQSQLTTASLAATSASITLAINQLAANQHAMMQQMMAYTNTAQNPALPPQCPLHSSPFLPQEILHQVEPRMVADGVNAGEGGTQLDLALAAGVTHTHYLPTMQLILGQGGGGLVPPLIPPAGGNFAAARNAAPHHKPRYGLH